MSKKLKRKLDGKSVSNKKRTEDQSDTNTSVLLESNTHCYYSGLPSPAAYINQMKDE
jgi:hypothetical protein